jgi:hypothetical protein
MRRTKPVILDRNPKGIVYAVITHEIDIAGQEKTFVELRQIKNPRMLIPYCAKQVDTVHEADMWQQIEHPELQLMCARQDNYWDDQAGIMVYGDIIDLHYAQFPRYCNDPFWQQFANPLMAYSGHGLAYKYWLTYPLGKPTGSDSADYFAAMAAFAHEEFKELPKKKDIIERWTTYLKEKTK